MNTLNRSLEKGEVVVLKKSVFKDEYQEQKHRVFRVDGSGFGSSSFTAGTAIFGEFLIDNEHCRMSGRDIDPKETEQYQSEHGKFGEKS